MKKHNKTSPPNNFQVAGASRRIDFIRMAVFGGQRFETIYRSARASGPKEAIT